MGVVGASLGAYVDSYAAVGYSSGYAAHTSDSHASGNGRSGVVVVVVVAAAVEAVGRFNELQFANLNLRCLLACVAVGFALVVFAVEIFAFAVVHAVVAAAEHNSCMPQFADTPVILSGSADGPAQLLACTSVSPQLVTGSILGPLFS